MKNKNIILIIFSFAIIFLLIFLYSKNFKKSKSNYNISRISANTIESKNNKIENNINNEIIPKTNNEILSTFSTKIYDLSEGRQNNLKITSNKLNNTIVKRNEIFSFCNTVGKATKEKGYKEAIIFDKYGNKINGLGGGNCQISSTLYNAVIAIKDLQIIERHEHSNKVPYIAMGKDAAVAYGSYDLKFKNNTNFDIKIQTDVNNSFVTVSLYKI